MMTVLTNCLTSKSICRSLLHESNIEIQIDLGKLLDWFFENLVWKIEVNREMVRKAKIGEMVK